MKVNWVWSMQLSLGPVSILRTLVLLSQACAFIMWQSSNLIMADKLGLLLL